MAQIRKAEEKDALGIAIVNAFTWMTQYRGLMSDRCLDYRVKNVANSVEKVKDRVKADDGYYVIIEENTVIGFCRFGNCVIDKYKECGQLYALYLLESFKGKGYGKELFNLAKTELKKQGFDKMIIGCLRGNPSIKFYEHMGAKQIDVIKFEYIEEAYNEDILVLDI